MVYFTILIVFYVIKNIRKIISQYYIVLYSKNIKLYKIYEDINQLKKIGKSGKHILSNIKHDI